MHILLGLVGIVAAIGIWIYRIRTAANVVRDVADMAGEAANLPRKMRFRGKAKRKGLDVIDDPREAAAVLMLCVVRVSGEVTPEHKSEIRHQMETAFSIEPDMSEEVLARASWQISEMVDESNAINKMIDFIIASVGRDEMPTLMNMIDAAAAVGGPADPRQKVFIRGCRTRAGLH